MADGGPTDGKNAQGVTLEAAVTVGVSLFGEDDERRRLERRWLASQLALLPKTVRRGVIDDDF